MQGSRRSVSREDASENFRLQAIKGRPGVVFDSEKVCKNRTPRIFAIFYFDVTMRLFALILMSLRIAAGLRLISPSAFQSTLVHNFCVQVRGYNRPDSVSTKLLMCFVLSLRSTEVSAVHERLFKRSVTF